MGRLFTIAGVGAMFLAAAGPALASWVRISHDVANVNQIADIIANTGLNDLSNAVLVNKSIGGVALTGSMGAKMVHTDEASAWAVTKVKANVENPCRVCPLVHLSKDVANINQTIDVSANTGANNLSDSATVSKSIMSRAVTGSSDMRMVYTDKAEAWAITTVDVNWN